jgi:putative ABC transport system permease protein
MLKTYIQLAFRSLLKNKVFSFINVIGLAAGLTCCLLISMYIYHESSYDAYQKNADRLYQLGTRYIMNGNEKRSGASPATMAPLMQHDFPEIESTTRFINLFQDDKTLLQYRAGTDIHSFYETKGYVADSNFFRLFTFDFKEGNSNTALNEPNTVVLSEEIAKKIFGDEPAVNKVIHINSNTNGEYDFKVTGVFIPFVTPSHMDAGFIISMKGGGIGNWVNSMIDIVNNNMFFSYVLLKPGTDPKKLEAKFDDFIKRHAGEELKASGRYRWQYLTPVKDIHLYANDENNVTPGGSVTYLYLLMSIAIITLLIACVNFMNLSTARSSKRAVEIGVRKVLGAEKFSLVRQFLCESILLAFISFVISLGLAALLMPLFEDVSGKEFSFSLQQYGGLFIAFLFITLVAGLIAGLYPAFYLSAFNPVKVLKGRFSNSLAALSFRKVLVVFQFVISVALIVASVTINNQMSYLRNKDLGFQKDQQLVIPLRTTTAKNIYSSLKDKLFSNASVTNAGATVFYPGINNSVDWLLYKQGNAPTDTRDIYINWTDDSYLQTLGIKPVAGRLFSKEFPADTANRIIINEQAVKEFGFATPQDAIGKTIAGDFGGGRLFNIIGVVKDFHFKDLHSSIESFGFFLNRRPDYNYLVAHTKAGALQSALNSIRTAWKQLNPDEPFEYSFLDQDFQKNYAAEDRLALLIRYFTIIAIFISCLGLFGLSTFSVEQRVKEIGIRKVLGASPAGIVSLLSKDFLKLVIISFFIATPMAWYFVSKWLQDFAYKAPFDVGIIVMAWSCTFLIAFITISIQAIKAAVSNPVKNLRIE